MFYLSSLKPLDTEPTIFNQEGCSKLKLTKCVFLGARNTFFSGCLKIKIIFVESSSCLGTFLYDDTLVVAMFNQDSTFLPMVNRFLTFENFCHFICKICHFTWPLI